MYGCLSNLTYMDKVVPFITWIMLHYLNMFTSTSLEIYDSVVVWFIVSVMRFYLLSTILYHEIMLLFYTVLALTCLSTQIKVNIVCRFLNYLCYIYIDHRLIHLPNTYFMHSSAYTVKLLHFIYYIIQNNAI